MASRQDFSQNRSSSSSDEADQESIPVQSTYRPTNIAQLCHNVRTVFCGKRMGKDSLEVAYRAALGITRCYSTEVDILLADTEALLKATDRRPERVSEDVEENVSSGGEESDSESTHLGDTAIEEHDTDVEESDSETINLGDTALKHNTDVEESDSETINLGDTALKHNTDVEESDSESTHLGDTAIEEQNTDVEGKKRYTSPKSESDNEDATPIVKPNRNRFNRHFSSMSDSDTDLQNTSAEEVSNSKVGATDAHQDHQDTDVQVLPDMEDTFIIMENDPDLSLATENISSITTVLPEMEDTFIIMDSNSDISLATEEMSSLKTVPDNPVGATDAHQDHQNIDVQVSNNPDGATDAHHNHQNNNVQVQGDNEDTFIVIDYNSDLSLATEKSSGIKTVSNSPVDSRDAHQDHQNTDVQVLPDMEDTFIVMDNSLVLSLAAENVSGNKTVSNNPVGAIDAHQDHQMTDVQVLPDNEDTVIVMDCSSDLSRATEIISAVKTVKRSAQASGFSARMVRENEQPEQMRDAHRDNSLLRTSFEEEPNTKRCRKDIPAPKYLSPTIHIIESSEDEHVDDSFVMVSNDDISLQDLEKSARTENNDGMRSENCELVHISNQEIEEEVDEVEEYRTPSPIIRTQYEKALRFKNLRREMLKRQRANSSGFFNVRFNDSSSGSE